MEQAEKTNIEKESQQEIDNSHNDLSVNRCEKWESFVKFTEETADKSLVSLLRNSVLLEMSETSLTIGLQNTKLFTKDKRDQIEISAKEFFKKEFTIAYKDSVDGIDDSVREKIEQERLKAEKETKKIATESRSVKQILSLFPKSRIKSIKIIEEKGDV